MTVIAEAKVNGRRPRVGAGALEAVRPTGLSDALLAFAAQAPKLRRDATGQIQSRTYGYTTIDSLLDDVNPLLLAHELLWTARVTIKDGAPAALYKMEHVPSREFEEWTGPLPCVEPGPQNLGSAITYMRRYTLQAYLNLAPGEDDDGAAASALPVVDKYADAAPRPTAAATKPSDRPCSAKQRAMLSARCAKAGLTPIAFANIILAATGAEVRDWDSDQGAATRWLKRALDRLPARHVDAVLEGIEAS